MSGRSFWEGTASELLSMIGSQGQGIPTTAVWLSIEVMKAHITDALKHYGLTVHRKRTASKRLLQLSHSVDASCNMASRNSNLYRYSYSSQASWTISCKTSVPLGPVTARSEGVG